MFYYVVDENKFKLQGVSHNGKCYDIISLLTTNTDVLTESNEFKFDIDKDTNEIYLSVKDNDNVFILDSLFSKFKKYFDNRVLTTLMLMDGLDSPEAQKFKEAVVRFVSANITPDTGITIKEMDNIFLTYLDFLKKNKGSAFMLDHRDVFNLSSVINNTTDDVRKTIEGIMKIQPEVFENRKILSENQKIFFYATNTSVMPSYDDIKDINVDTVDKYNLKMLVPRFHNYIGGYVNYKKGTAEYTGSYTDGEYIRKSSVAALLNDFRFREVLNNYRTLYSNVEIGNNSMTITDKYITGDSDYDADGIRPNEEEYYNELCKFVDECLYRDILEAPVNEWTKLGLKITDYIPELKYTMASLSKIDYETLELTDDESRGFNHERLESRGLTKEAFTSLNAGSPTSNKWFEYAINVALTATRAYTGSVPLPFGYDASDFCRTIKVPRHGFDEKYRAYSNNEYFAGDRLRSLDDIDNTGDSDVSADDYESTNSAVGYAYWYNVAKSGDSEEGGGSADMIIDTDMDDTDELLTNNFDNLLDSIIEYCLNSNILYALPEALIKCLRFGNKKPKCLQLDSLESRVDLTTCEIITDINYDNPVLYDGKQFLISKIVKVDKVSKSVQEFYGMIGQSKIQPFIVGVGLRSRYQQSDGSIANVTEYYDIQTLVKDKELQSKIANLGDGEIIESTPMYETVQDAMQSATRNVTSISIQPNDTILLNVLNKYTDEIEEPQTRKILNALNKRGFNMFTFANALETLSNVTKYSELIKKGQLINKLRTIKTIPNAEEFLNVDILIRYGSIISKTSSLTSDGNKLFYETFNLWSTEADYSLDIGSISEGSSNNGGEGVYAGLVKNIVGTEKYNVMAFKDKADSKDIRFYMLQGCTNKSNRFIISGTKLSVEILRKTVYTDKMAVNVVQALLNNIEMVKKQKPSMTVKDIINGMFKFVDDETKETLINIASNMIKL